MGVLTQTAHSAFLHKSFSPAEVGASTAVARTNAAVVVAADEEKTEELVSVSENQVVLKNYLAETRWMIKTLRTKPECVPEILRVLSITKDSSFILGFTPIYKLYKAIEDLYKTIYDGKTAFSPTLHLLINETTDTLAEMCGMIERGHSAALYTVNIRPYLLYLDKAISGEIYDSKNLLAERKDEALRLALLESKELESENEGLEELGAEIRLEPSQITELVNQHQEMIARSYIMMNQLELLKAAILDGDKKSAKESYSQLAADCQSLQSNLLLSHEQLVSFMPEDSALHRNKDFYGFFVLANGRKYLIPSEYVIDVISETTLDYEEKQNQKYIVYIQENESGNEKNREEIPVYSLSSLLPGTLSQERRMLDTVILVNYQAQKIGIIVDSVLKFVSLIKMPLPDSFKHFPILQGLVFDEKYDMIPVLYMPGIMKKFRAMRGYDVKKFEAATQKSVRRILIVDDSETTRMIERTILEGNGFLVEEAADGIEAIKKIKEIQFDLLLSDDAMPRMGGEIFLDNVRRMKNYVSVPVIALSNAPIPKADDFIKKSDFTRDMLIQKIKELLYEPPSFSS